jgi:hypothetical protein
MPMFAVGLGYAIEITKQFLSKKAIKLLALIFILHNLIMIMVFHLFLHEPTFIGSKLSQSGKLRQKIIHLFFNN